jgi:hypothetical protein
MKMADHKYKMTMSLNVLNHLGIKLYSNVPSVLSEVVANAWDADAEKVDIVIDKGKITIGDNGQGMTVDEANKKYLYVGYERRKEKGEDITPKHHRPVMGRKGIGKLSLFSIADTIKVYSKKGKEKHGFIMSAKKIQKLLKNKKNKDYNPDPIPEGNIDLNGHNTEIVITDLKKKNIHTAPALKKRIARRFSIIGSEYKFSVFINGDPVTVSDRDYFHKLQYLWYYGSESKKYVDYCDTKKLSHSEFRKNKVRGYKVSGWIGSVEKSGDLKDGTDKINKIGILARGKLAQEDILEEFTEGGMYTKYLIGEIHADFLDQDNKEDIATSSRQKIIEDDPRYEALKKWIQIELKYIESSWTDLRNKGGTKKALENPAIKEWFNSLKSKNKKRAESLFGKINQLTLDSDAEKQELFKYSVLAFESLRYKENLEALDSLSPGDIGAFRELFADCDDIEAALYHQIVKERLQIIDKLHSHIEKNDLEKVVQSHLYDHLWLRDPSWDRATETPYMEQSVGTAFNKINAGLSAEEKKGRIDIKYKTTSGKHLIIELKRANRAVSDTELMDQVLKYHEALRKILKEAGKDREPIEVICLVGKNLKNWTDETNRKTSELSLSAKNIRVVLYQQLIEDAYRSYKAFLEKNKEAGRIATLIENIESKS